MIEAWVEKGFVVCPENGSEQELQKPNGHGPTSWARFMTRSSDEIAEEEEPEPKPQKGFWARLWGKTQKAPPLYPWKPFSIPPTGESLSALSMPYTVIEWEGNPSATYPMQSLNEAIFQGDFSFPHSLGIELSDDFSNLETDGYEDAKQVSTICNCGYDLAYEGHFGFMRIRRICPTCGTAFRPQDQIAEIPDARTGDKIPQPGGLCNRFGITIYFSKEHPLYVPDPSGELVDATPRVTSAFMETCCMALGAELNEFSYFS